METISLYNGAVELNFDPLTHVYTVDDQEIGNSISETLKIINKPFLLRWHVQKAIDFIKEYLQPGMALDEMQISDLLKDAKDAATRYTASAADLGTMGHQWIETYLKDPLNPPPMPYHEGLQNVVDTFLDFLQAHDIQPIFTERRIYSREFQIAGTLDCLCWFDGELAILDWKTGTDIYDDHFLQMGGYSLCYHEERESDPTLPGPVVKHVIVNCSKTGKLKVAVSDKVAENEEGFRSALALKRRLEQIHEERKKRNVRR